MKRITDCMEAETLLGLSNPNLKWVPKDGGYFEFRFNRRVHDITQTTETMTARFLKSAKASNCIIGFMDALYERDHTWPNVETAKEAIILLRFTLEKKDEPKKVHPRYKSYRGYEIDVHRVGPNNPTVYACPKLGIDNKPTRASIEQAIDEACEPVSVEMLREDPRNLRSSPSGNNELYRAQFSEAELAMFDAIFKHSETELELTERQWDWVYRMGPSNIYSMAVNEAFLHNMSGPAVESLRRCMRALQDPKVPRLTPEFDALIQLDPNIHYRLEPVTFENLDEVYSPPNEMLLKDAVAKALDASITKWRVIVWEIGPTPVKVTVAMRNLHPGWGLKEAKEFIDVVNRKSTDALPQFMTGLTLHTANSIAQQLIAVGCVVGVEMTPESQQNL